jgi:hypothetical protein
MNAILKIAGLVLEQLGSLVVDEFFWIIIFILIVLYKRSSGVEERMLGASYPLFSKVSGSVFAGFAGGLLGSALVILVGISIEDYTKAGGGSLTDGLTYIWIVAILLSLINPRYLCFSYAGGIIALMNLFFGFPSVNVPGLLALIGVLHLVESFLIWLDGFTYSAPLFLQRKDGETVGGYVMNRIWPVPLVVFAVMYGGEGSGVSLAGMLDMPAWWPFIKHSAAGGMHNLVYVPLVAPVILGYGDMAVTKMPDKKCRSSAVRLAVYSLILITLSVIASKFGIFAFIAAVFAPLAHEMLILYGAREEEEGKPYFADNEAGLKVLFVQKDSPASSMKLKPGDSIIGINGMSLSGENQLTDFLSSYPTFIWLDIKKPRGEVITAEYSDYREGIGSLGVLIVPRNSDFYYEKSGGSSFIKKVADRFRKKRDKGIDV